MHGVYPNKLIDHVNGIKSDNRINNLRLADEFQSAANKSIMKNNTSGFKGVTKNRNKWRAQINYKKQTYNLGVFDTPEIASVAYENKAKELHNSFYYKDCRS